MRTSFDFTSIIIMIPRRTLLILSAISSLDAVQAQYSETLPGPGNSTVPVFNPTYDYIVVGGGASGLIVSERFAETGKSVLVLERGGPSLYSSGGDLLTLWNDTLTLFDVPAMMNALLVPGNNVLCTDVPAGAYAGCVLGGGTAVNGLQFVRPASFDFDDKWPAGWKWADVQAAAERLYERNPGAIIPSADGKLYDNDVYDVASKFMASGGYTQVDTNEEPDKKYKVYSYPAINTEGGFRAGPVRTYLPIAKGLPDFKLQLHTKVVRTVRTGSTITGVEIEDAAGQRSVININSGGKVILAAGAMSSPRILFNSGIGPADQIEIVRNGSARVSLPPKEEWIHSPVGFVRDHPIVIVTFNVTQGMNYLTQTELINPSQEFIDLYTHGSGPLAQAWNRMMSYTTVVNDDGHRTLVQCHFAGASNKTIQVLVALTHNSTSTGALGITPDGNTRWIKNPYLQSESDREAMVKAIDELLAMSHLPNSTLSYSGPANASGASILEVALSRNASTATFIPGQHMIGTTIMGTDDGTKNGSSVVDTDCKVYGTGIST
jgi:cellobiose dehydrogenase (acceptor)